MKNSADQVTSEFDINRHERMIVSEILNFSASTCKFGQQSESTLAYMLPTPFGHKPGLEQC